MPSRHRVTHNAERVSVIPGPSSICRGELGKCLLIHPGHIPGAPTNGGSERPTAAQPGNDQRRRTYA